MQESQTKIKLNQQNIRNLFNNAEASLNTAISKLHQAGSHYMEIIAVVCQRYVYQVCVRFMHLALPEIKHSLGNRFPMR